MKRIRVVVIDDSNVVQILLERVLGETPDLSIVGRAFNGAEGVGLVLQKSPDVAIMDITMPEMNGLEAIGEIMSKRPTPIVVFSAASREIVNVSYQAIELGAVDIVEKPHAADMTGLRKAISETLVGKIRLFAGLKLVTRKAVKPAGDAERAPATAPPLFPPGGGRIIGVAASTGGPQTIRTFIGNLRTVRLEDPIVIVQHMADGFMRGFCDWLASQTALPVFMASAGEYPEPGRIYIAPGGRHLVIDERGRIGLSDGEPVQGIRPSADVFFASLAEYYRERAVAVVLTGMGSDGARGAARVKARGGFVIAQDRASSLIFGMPGAAIDTGCVDAVVGIDELHAVLFAPSGGGA